MRKPSAFLLLAISAFAAEDKLPLAAKVEVDFVRDIEPIFKRQCQACHGSAQQMSGLRLDDSAKALRRGYSGVVILPGSSARSRLIHLVADTEEKVVMPPGGKRLSAEQVGLLRAWIDQGAKWPARAKAASAVESRSNHWSFQPVGRPGPPQTKNIAWGRNPIDQFILERLEKEGI
jgi:mono/diheme cytochrome c family protein